MHSFLFCQCVCSTLASACCRRSWLLQFLRNFKHQNKLNVIYHFPIYKRFARWKERENCIAMLRPETGASRRFLLFVSCVCVSVFKPFYLCIPYIYACLRWWTCFNGKYGLLVAASISNFFFLWLSSFRSRHRMCRGHDQVQDEECRYCFLRLVYQ